MYERLGLEHLYLSQDYMSHSESEAEGTKGGVTHREGLGLLIHTKTTNYPERKPQRYRYPSQPPVVDNRRIHGTELAVLDERALRKDTSSPDH